MALKINYTNNKKGNELNGIEVVGCFCKDENYETRWDLSQLTYYNPPPKETWRNVRFDLNRNYEQVKRKPVDPVDFGINDLLKWILRNLTESEIKSEEEKRLNADFVAFRGTFTKLLTLPYERREGWIICAAKFRNTIYLCAFDTEDRKEWKEKMDKRCMRMCSWGFKFEQYILAEKPNEKPNPSRPVKEAEEFNCIFQSKIGNHRLLYGAEVDGVVSSEVLKEPIDWKKVKFVELKTSALIRDSRGMEQTIKNKFIKWWSQSSLVDVDHLLCGFRTNNGIVVELKSYKLQELVNSSKQFWDPNVCFNFTNDFLTFVKEQVICDYNECIYKFEWYPHQTEIKVEKMSATSECAFLRDWFVKEMNATFQS